MKTVKIPIPPSGNHMYNQRVIEKWVETGGRMKKVFQTIKFPTEEYKAWLDQASPLIEEAFTDMAAPVVVFIRIYGGSGFPESRDCDNVQKCIGDALQIREFEDKSIRGSNKRRPYGAGVLQNDNVVRLKGWDIRYFDRAEHLARLDELGCRPKRKDDLEAAVYLKFVPA